MRQRQPPLRTLQASHRLQQWEQITALSVAGAEIRQHILCGQRAQMPDGLELEGALQHRQAETVRSA